VAFQHIRRFLFGVEGSVISQTFHGPVGNVLGSLPDIKIYFRESLF